MSSVALALDVGARRSRPRRPPTRVRRRSTPARARRGDRGSATRARTRAGPGRAAPTPDRPPGRTGWPTSPWPSRRRCARRAPAPVPVACRVTSTPCRWRQESGSGMRRRVRAPASASPMRRAALPCAPVARLTPRALRNRDSGDTPSQVGDVGTVATARVAGLKHAAADAPHAPARWHASAGRAVNLVAPHASYSKRLSAVGDAAKAHPGTHPGARKHNARHPESLQVTGGC